MNTVCEKGTCTGCMACKDVCATKAITIQDNISAFNAVIDMEKCVHCGACHSICQNNHPIEAREPIVWYQGWVKDAAKRKASSSGGIATGLMETFVENGGVVYSCVFHNGEFRFESESNVGNLQKFTGSKYVKSDPTGVYKAIKKDLVQQKRVLFIGLPCQVVALKKVVGERLERNLYTVDLICHGTPSPKLLELFLQQHDMPLKSTDNILFRNKTNYRLIANNVGVDKYGVMDRYTIAFLKGLIYTENCYRCAYAKGSRVSDLTLGDSWGSELPLEEQRNGISLILCQTQKGKALVSDNKFILKDVNLRKAIESNHQLEAPAKAPKGRTLFFNRIKQGKNFDALVFRCCPKMCIRQIVKRALIKYKFLGR